MKLSIKRRLWWAFTVPVVAVVALWAYQSVPLTASWAEFGYYGKFNQVQRIIREIPGLTIVEHTQHHDLTMEDFSFTVTNRDGAVIRIDFWENGPEMRLTKDADIRLYIESVIAHPIRESRLDRAAGRCLLSQPEGGQNAVANRCSSASTPMVTLLEISYSVDEGNHVGLNLEA